MMRLRDQSGMTFIEVLVAMSISFIVFAATLSVVDTTNRQKKLTDAHNDAQQRTRVSLDRLAQELRNLASPTDLTSASSTKPLSVDWNGPFDFVFRSVAPQEVGAAGDANVQRVRYCLESGTGRVWRMEQPVPTAAFSIAGCGAGVAGWSNPRVVAEHVRNETGTRTLFTYSSDSKQITATDDASRQEITRVHTSLFVDPDPARRPIETNLSTGVQLRNQNREPAALFTATVVNASTMQVRLNCSASEDPENTPLTYKWYDGTTLIPNEGLIVEYQSTGTTKTRTYKLEVSDAAGLSATCSATINFLSPPTSGVQCTP